MRRWQAWVARIGYSAKAVVYAVVAVLAADGAIRRDRREPRSIGDVAWVVAESHLGRVLLVVLAAGLLAFAIWSLLQAVADTERKGRSWKGIFVRAGYASVAVVYGTMAIKAATLLGGAPSAAAEHSERHEHYLWLRHILATAWGPYLIGLAGLASIGFGLATLVLGWRGKLERTEPPAALRWLARIGIAARGVVFVLLGAIVVVSAAQGRPSPTDTGAVMRRLLRTGSGATVVAVLAMGLFAYALAMLIEARYHADNA
jgi:Domain of Unknown Function (DUF1206)